MASEILEPEEGKTEKTEISDLQARYSALRGSISNISDKKTRELLMALGSIIYKINEQTISNKQKNESLEEKLERATKNLRRLFGPDVKKIMDDALEYLRRGEISVAAETLLTAFLSKPENVLEMAKGFADYASSKRGREQLDELRRTTVGRKVIKKLLYPFRKLKIRSYIETAAIAIIISAPFAGTAWYLRNQTSEARMLGKINGIETVLKQGPKTKEEQEKIKGLSAHFSAQFQPKGNYQPAGNYVTQENLPEILKPYSTSEEIAKSLSDLESRIKKDRDSVIAAKFMDYEEFKGKAKDAKETASVALNATEDLRQRLETSEKNYQDILTAKKGIETDIATLKKSSASSEDLTSLTKLYNLLSQRLDDYKKDISELRSLYETQQQDRLQENLEFLRTPPKLELYSPQQPAE